MSVAASTPLAAAATCYYQVTGNTQVPIRGSASGTASIVGYIPGKAYFFGSCGRTNANWIFTDDLDTYAVGYVYYGNVTKIATPAGTPEFSVGKSLARILK